MTIKQKIEVLKKRKKLLSQAVQLNKRVMARAAGKSHYVRRGMMAGPRADFFRDLEIEVGYAIEFLEGKSTAKEYLAVQLGEDEVI